MSNGNTWIVIYVDDCLIMGDLAEINRINTIFQQEWDKTTLKVGKVVSYMGMLLEVHDGFATISMKSYIEGMQVGINYINDKATSSMSDLFEVSIESPKLSEPDGHHFHRVVAQLLYLAMRERPDVLVTTGFLCTRV